MAIKLLINAIHSKAGGGLVYLNSILPHMAKDKNLNITVLCHKNYHDRLLIPKGVKVQITTYPDNFFITLIWEQFVLPILARSWKMQITLCIANFAPLFAPKPLILLTNNPEVRNFTTSIKQKIYWWALIIMTKLSLIFCVKAFSNGVYLQDIFIKGWFKRYCKKIYNAPAASDFIPPMGVEKVKNQLLAIGDFYVHKDYPLLLQGFALALNKHPDLKLIIVGRAIDKAVFNQVQNLIKQLKIEDNVEIKGFMPHTKLAKLIASSAMYISTSRAETFSLTLLEALSCKTPSVVFNYPFHREVAGVDGAVYVKVDSVEGIAVTIINVIDNPTKATNITLKGYARTKNYSWEKTAKVICKVIANAK